MKDITPTQLQRLLSRLYNHHVLNPYTFNALTVLALSQRTAVPTSVITAIIGTTRVVTSKLLRDLELASLIRFHSRDGHREKRWQITPLGLDELHRLLS